jgi:limonene-1,2-epoxide hydrolase
MSAISHGVAELRTFGEKVLSDFSDIRFELQSSFTDGSRGGAEWVMRGARDLTGTSTTEKRVEIRGVSIFEFAGDRIRRCSDYWDMATYLKQLGIAASV